MKTLRAATVALFAATASVVSGGIALAEPGNSQAAHLCLDGPQVDEYLVDGQPVEAGVDFGNLPHGVTPSAESADGFAWVETDSHGQCVALFAQARKGKTSGGKVTIHDIQIVKVIDKASPR
jgi:hypothetical protein